MNRKELRRSLFNKLEDKEFVESLSEKTRRRLFFAQMLLSDDELRENSSIQVAYDLAKDRYLEDYLKKYDIMEYIRVKNNPSIPTFNKKHVINAIRNGHLDTDQAKFE